MNIIVVGAGIVGCAIAHELASRGAHVRVIDPRGTGRGATHASAGILAPYVEGHLAPLLALGVHSLALYDRFIQRVIDDSGQPVEYERTGTLQVARDSSETANLCAAAHVLAASDVAHAILDPSETRQLEPEVRNDITAALYVPEHGYVTAGSLTRALAAAAAKRGALITNARAIAIADGEAPGVVTSDGTMHGDAVIVAAGSWSGLLAEGKGSPGAAEAGATPCAGHAAAVKPMRGQLVQLRLASRPASRVIWGSRCYLVPWRDGTVLAGATVEDVGFDERATAAGVQHLLAASAELMPILRDASFEEVRVGLRPMTRDELPAIGPSSTMRSVFYATGHYRNGVLLAPLTAALVSDLVLEGREGAELALVRPDRLGL